MLRRIAPWIALVAGVAMLTYLVALHALPSIVMRAAVGRLADRGGGINQMAHAPLATAEARTIVRPSPDLAYSSCPFDLGKGAVTVTVLPVAAPYWSLSVYDSQTNAVFVRNDREVRGQPVRIAIARQGQTIPAGYVPVWVNGNRGVALLRILVPNAAAFPAIDVARKASSCQVAATS
jgi:uncharacterized membrane protein